MNIFFLLSIGDYLMTTIFSTAFWLQGYSAILLTFLAVISYKIYYMLLQTSNKNQEQLDRQEFNQELEDKIIQRTSFLELKNKDLEDFNYMVSHDLKAPLKNIKGLTAILKTEVSGEHKVTVTHIATMANRMEQLIGKLFLYSKAQQLSVQKSVFDLEKMMNSCYEEVTKEYHYKNIQFDLQTLPKAFGDEVAIRQVRQNLLSNALKYASKKPIIKIIVYAKQQKNQLVIGIKDNGTGFNEEEKDKLFQRFQRLHKSSEFEGTGLGLAICQQIIEKHNGKIWAENNKQAGATFYFSLPLASTNVKEENSSSSNIKFKPNHLRGTDKPVSKKNS